MKKYRVNVNGTAYEVEIEEMSASDVSSASASAPTAAPKAESAAPASAGALTVKSPMPGTILSVNVSTGQSVKKGDILMILEAMKMENEILASQDGTVASVNVTKGAAVDSGDVLCTLN
ncbi:MAG: biotin/lipoyl-binding protein [Oscillospiraceae bacterium]|nr:biotin/lipoyl-binding protein [Oscillospiraceae bacterium]